MEELILDRGIDPAFKIRLKSIMDEMLENLDDVVKESKQSYILADDLEDRKIIQRKHSRFNFEEDNVDFNF